MGNKKPLIMTNANDPAFTGPTENGFTPGLTKREYFAAMAMQGLITKGGMYGSREGFAEQAISIADVIIKELNKSKS